MIEVYHTLGSLALLALGWAAGHYGQPKVARKRQKWQLWRAGYERVYNDLWYNEGMVNTDITGHEPAGSGPPHADSERADSAADVTPDLENDAR